MSDIFKKSSKKLQATFKSDYGVDVRSSHAHAAIAGFLGFNSKKAFNDHHGEHLKNASYIPEGEENYEKLQEALERMRETPLKNYPAHEVANVIEQSLPPLCEECGCRDESYRSLHSNESSGWIDEPDGYVCQDCLSQNRDEYATCRYCGEDMLYRADEINEAGECSEHEGEGSFTDEEMEDWESYIENVTKDL